MKRIAYYIVFSIAAVALYSCNISDDAPQFIQTTVSGQIIDQERNTVYSNDTITLSAVYPCGTGFTSGVCYELIASTVTDSNGAYEFIFDYHLDKAYTVHRTSTYTYYGEEEYLPRIEPGEINTIDFMGWRPVIFKVNATVSNNIFPELTFHSRDDNDFIGLYSFPFYKIQEENTSTTVYLHGKPNTQMSISFSYTDNNTQNNYHERREIMATMVQDSIAVSYEIDCSGF